MVKRKKKQKKHRSWQSVTLCISTAMVLVLLGMVVLSVFTARNLSTYVRENFVITLTLEDDMTMPETQQLTKSLKRKRYVNHLQFISKEQALKEQVVAMGSDPTEFIGANPFMASIEVYLDGDYANTDSLRWVQKELKRYPKVSEITFQSDLMDSVNTNLQRVNLVLLALALLLTIVSITLVNNTVRLGVYARRFNIHTMKLGGASWSFIRWPFIRKSLWIGFLASVIANIVLAGCLYGLYYYQPGVTEIITWEVMAITAAAVFAFGIVFTWICTYVSVNKFLKMKASKLYKI